MYYERYLFSVITAEAAMRQFGEPMNITIRASKKICTPLILDGLQGAYFVFFIRVFVQKIRTDLESSLLPVPHRII